MLDDVLEYALTFTMPNKTFPATSTVDSGRSRLHLDALLEVSS